MALESPYDPEGNNNNGYETFNFFLFFYGWAGGGGTILYLPKNTHKDTIIHKISSVKLILVGREAPFFFLPDAHDICSIKPKLDVSMIGYLKKKNIFI